MRLSKIRKQKFVLTANVEPNNIVLARTVRSSIESNVAMDTADCHSLISNPPGEGNLLLKYCLHFMCGQLFYFDLTHRFTVLGGKATRFLAWTSHRAKSKLS